jgi:hypothetical protein
MGKVMMIELVSMRAFVRSSMATFPAFVLANPDGFGAMPICNAYKN